MKQTNHVLNEQKAVSNPFLKTTQPTANTTAQQEYMNSCKEGKCQNSYLPHVRYSLQAPLQSKGVYVELRSIWWKSLCSETAWYCTDTPVLLIPTPTKLCSSSAELKQLSHHHRGLEALQQVWAQHKHAASWKLLYWAAPPWQRQCIGLVIDVLETLECSCSFPVSKQPVLLKQAASNNPGHDREEMPEPLFLSIPTSFNG